MKKNQLIIGGIVLGVAGYFGYKFWKKKKREKIAEGEKPSPTPTPTPAPVYSGPSEYQRKVMKLQGTVGAAIDGVPGPNTNLSVKNYFPVSFSRLGNVSAANIDSYLALGNKREQAAMAQTVSTLEKAAQLLESGKSAITISAMDVPVLIWDEYTQAYKRTGFNQIKANVTIPGSSYNGYTTVNGVVFNLPANYFNNATSGNRNVGIPLSNLIFQ